MHDPKLLWAELAANRAAKRVANAPLETAGPRARGRRLQTGRPPASATLGWAGGAKALGHETVDRQHSMDMRQLVSVTSEPSADGLWRAVITARGCHVLEGCPTPSWDRREKGLGTDEIDWDHGSSAASHDPAATAANRSRIARQAKAHALLHLVRGPRSTAALVDGLAQDVTTSVPIRRYRPIDMPDRFVLEVLTDEGEWIDSGLYAAADFAVSDDGAYVCQGAGSPMWLRCLRQDNAVVYVVDGGGDPYVYRLVPFPSDRYRIGEGK